MKRLVSCILILSMGLCITACGGQAPALEETSPTLPEGDYLMIPLNPDAIYAIESGHTNIPEGAYLTVVSPSGEKYAILLRAKGEDPGTSGTLMNTSSGDKVLMFKEDGHYSFAKTTTKTRSCYSEDDQLLWEMTVTATFLYDGTGVECTEVSGEVYIAATGSWYVISEKPEAAGNTASYTVEFGRSALGVTTSSSSYTVTVSCDEQGNLS